MRNSVLLAHPPHAMYSLVTAVEDYPKFVPWCDSAEVLERRPDGETVRLGLAYMGVRQKFTTRNEHETDRRVGMHLVDGPFSTLEGVWRFLPLGPDAAACKVEFELRYELAHGPLDRLLSPVFDRIASTFIEAFVKRAEAGGGTS